MSLENKTNEEYNKRFSEEDRKILKIHSITPKQANQYPERFSGWGIARLIKANCSPERADEYSQRFDGLVVARLAEANISSELADKYSKRFSNRDITELAKSKISPERADEYSQRFDGYEIARLSEVNCSPLLADEYNQRFDGRIIARLSEAKCSPEQADQYPERFEGQDIFHLVGAFFLKKAISPEQASQYPERFDGWGIANLIKSNISPEQANQYPERFSGWDIFHLFKAGISPEQANQYPERFSGWGITELVKSNISPQQAEPYDKRLGGVNIAKLVKSNIHPGQYPERFSFWEISHLIDANISPEQADQYPNNFFGGEISLLCRIGFTPESVALISEGVSSILERIVRSGEVRTHPDEFNILGTGSSAAVLLKEDSAWKFSQQINQEYGLLKRIQDKYNGNQKNIVKLIGEPKEDLALEIQYIQGQTLQSILEQHSLSPEKVLKYGAGIMNGLIEMRRAKIWYHRDIRPANIMIDEERDEPVIVDFGIATEDRHALPLNNKRFGGPNDLTSLGQVMYYMATGMHIFDQSQSMSRTFGSVADEINDYRTKVYSDPTGKLLEQHLGQVDSEIKDERVATLIKACLTARRGQYKRMQRMFGRYEE
jgi:hypothetical protein